MDPNHEKDLHKYKILPIVVVVIFDKNSRVLLLKRKKEDIFQGFWEVVGGRLEFGERIVNAAKRELKEEAGIDGEPKFITFLEHIGREYNLGDQYHRIMFVFSCVSSSQNVVLSEHDECGWYSPDAFPENIIPFNQEAIEACLKQI